MLTTADIYHTLDRFAPFDSQSDWDNSGLIVGDFDMPAQRILTTLDISEAAIARAKEEGVTLIVSHHPVIFSPLKHLSAKSPVFQLAQNNIAAICIHTPLDIAPRGLNWSAHEKLSEFISFSGTYSVLEPAWNDGRGFGWIDDIETPLSAEELATVVEAVFRCGCVNFSTGAREIHRIAYCSGAGGSMLESAAEKGCDALITGDIKHDRWYKAQECGITLVECDHYHTESFAANILADVIRAAYPESTVIADPGDAPFACFAPEEREVL